ncbi:hypothetical protein ACFVWN_29645 [Nocardiopsis flavescens]|uniref:hypothetical protein n=1 Tax=Nocardiopsis flavescens TaxID=758803 RepID=UPI003655E1DE
MTETDRSPAAPPRRIPAPTRLTAAVAAALLLVGGVVVHDRYQYASGHDYGTERDVLRVHVFDGDRPGDDVSAHVGPAEQECAEHGADDGEGTGSPRWLQGCVDAVLGR